MLPLLTARGQIYGLRTRNLDCLCSLHKICKALVSPTCSPDREDINLQILSEEALRTVQCVKPNPSIGPTPDNRQKPKKILRDLI